MSSYNTVSSMLIRAGTDEYIQLVDVMKNYFEWSFKPKENPEEVASEFIISLCPKLSYNRVLRMLVVYHEVGKINAVTPEIFVENYLEENEIIKEEYVKTYYF